MSLTAIIVDDEPLARSRLKRLLESQGVIIVAEGSNGEEAVNLSQAYTCDMLFLDINMPIRNGLSAAEEISSTLDKPPSIVFCTAYDEHALEAFKSNASAYLMKPITLDSLSGAIEQAGRLNKLQLRKIQDLPGNSASHLVLESTEALENVRTSEIYYFRSIDKHVYAYVEDRGEVLVNYTLKSLYEMFSDSFIRVHRSALVNRAKLLKLSPLAGGGHELSLDGVEKLFDVSRRHLKEVKKCF